MTETSWPPNYLPTFIWRQQELLKLRSNPDMLLGAKEYYRTRPEEFITDWVDTYDPRNAGKEGMLTRMPFLLFPKQKEMLRFLLAVLNGEEDGLIEKCRDAGATWVCVAFTVWLWLFWPGIAIGWGSRKEQYVDKLGVVDSIFEKIRQVITHLPPEFLPEGFSPKDHLSYMRIINPENESVIVGEAGDNIGRGGRTRIYFKDESAHYERPELVEAALGDNTRCQIDISSVNGLGNVFHRKREAGEEWIDGPAIKGKTNVFIFDWSDHPAKNQEWYDKRKKKSADDGLAHIFAQEVDRNYSAAVEGLIIDADHVSAAIDAHLKLPGLDWGSGGWCAALDVADGGRDTNALSIRKGVVLKSIEEWSERDTAVTARRAASACRGITPIDLQYDCIGVGAGVKGEANRLKDDDVLPKGLSFVPWNAAAGVLDPKSHVVEDDDETPLNKDVYHNLKAQAWGELNRRLEKTYRMVKGTHVYPVEELISFDSSSIEAKALRKMQKELSQPVWGKSTTMKRIVDKTPKGTKSPNTADSVVMNYLPIRGDVDFDWYIG